MIFELTSTRPLAEIGQRLQEAAARHGFGVLGVHDLKQTLQKKGFEYNGECQVYEICQPRQAKTILDAKPVISCALPCRVSIYSSGGSTCLATIRPTALLSLFNVPDARPVAEEVEREILAMMTESA